MAAAATAVDITSQRTPSRAAQWLPHLIILFLTQQIFPMFHIFLHFREVYQNLITDAYYIQMKNQGTPLFIGPG